MHQSGNYHKQYAYGDNGCSTEARERLLGIQNACNIQHANGSQEHYVGAPFGE